MMGFMLQTSSDAIIHRDPRSAALIGLDWPDGKHDICLQIAGQLD